MPYPRYRRSVQKAREAENRLANEWTICGSHGGFSPNVRDHHRWIRRDCPRCAQARYEAGGGHLGAATPSGE